MRKPKNRAEEIKLILQCISLPLIVVEIQAYNRSWKQKEFGKLTNLLLEELHTLLLEVSI